MDKKDPVIPDMVQWLQSQAPTAGNTSVLTAIADWTTLGLSAGFCISEYGQTSATFWKEWMSTGKNGSARHLPRAFIHSDVPSLMSNGDCCPCTVAPEYIFYALPGTNKWMVITLDTSLSEKRLTHSFAQCWRPSGFILEPCTLTIEMVYKGSHIKAPSGINKSRHICEQQLYMFMDILKQTPIKSSCRTPFEWAPAYFFTKQDVQRLLSKTVYVGNQNLSWNI